MTKYTFFSPDVNTWKQALKGIPRVPGKAAWMALDPVSRWLIATRSAVLIMTLLAAIVAGIYAQLLGGFDWLRFLIMTLGIVLAHATNNILNDLTDSKRGVDKDNAFRTQYGTQPVEQGFMSMAASRRMALGTGLVAALCGLYLVLTGSDLLVWFFLAGLFFLFAYNWPLKHFGLGEPLVVVVWGPMMIGGGFLAVTGFWSWDVAIASLPYALGPTAVLFGKHIDKIPWDKPRKVRTLPVLLGESLSRPVTTALLITQYLVVIYLILTGFFWYSMFLVLGALPFFFKRFLPVFSKPVPDAPPADYPKDAWPLWFSSHAFVHNRKFGGLFMLGLLLQMLFA